MRLYIIVWLLPHFSLGWLSQGILTTTIHKLQSFSSSQTSYSTLKTSLPSTNDNVSLARMGLNELQTLLREAVKEEDFDNAILYRNELADRLSNGAYTPEGELDRS